MKTYTQINNKLRKDILTLIKDKCIKYSLLELDNINIKYIKGKFIITNKYNMFDFDLIKYYKDMDNKRLCSIADNINKKYI